ncbi:MAG: cytochrome c oxidase assembly protein COX16 [Ruminococcus sp.]|nr:cytochrome c oxidase assembly protein COX16 [Ruminococcus sp.]MCM1233148.1 cytochrome c oxidase assembly protein COX16 [Ruminococcus flavefaciens]
MKARKLTYDEMFNSTTMFYINKDCEEKIKQDIEAQTTEILVGLKTITSKETLKQYIIDHKDSLDRLTSVAEISEERFKRMVSMIRKDRGFVFATEWGLSKIHSAMLESSAMMESVLNLIWDGKHDPKLQECIPSFYLENMSMDKSTLAKIQDEYSVRQLVKRGLEGTYSNMIGDAILADIEKELKRVCAKHGLEHKKNVRVPRLDRAVSFVLEAPTNPKIILDVSYSVTTSSSQGSKKEAARKTEAIIKEERAAGNNIIFVNFLDGAGWIGRQADLREIHRCSDYVLNFQNIGLLEDIIDAHINEL